MKDKLNELRRMLEGLSADGVCAAFSGGVDSSLLLTVLSEISARKQFPLLAVVFATVTAPAYVPRSSDCAKSESATMASDG